MNVTFNMLRPGARRGGAVGWGRVLGRAVYDGLPLRRALDPVLDLSEDRDANGHQPLEGCGEDARLRGADAH